MNRDAMRKAKIKPQAFGAERFDEELIRKIVEFQEANELEPDGIAGSKTIEKLPVGENKILEFLFKFTDEIENELV